MSRIIFAPPVDPLTARPRARQIPRCACCPPIECSVEYRAKLASRSKAEGFPYLMPGGGGQGYSLRTRPDGAGRYGTFDPISRAYTNGAGPGDLGDPAGPEFTTELLIAGIDADLAAAEFAGATLGETQAAYFTSETSGGGVVHVSDAATVYGAEKQAIQYRYKLTLQLPHLAGKCAVKSRSLDLEFHRVGAAVTRSHAFVALEDEELAPGAGAVAAYGAWHTLDAPSALGHTVYVTGPAWQPAISVTYLLSDPDATDQGAASKRGFLQFTRDHGSGAPPAVYNQVSFAGSCPARLGAPAKIYAGSLILAADPWYGSDVDTVSSDVPPFARPLPFDGGNFGLYETHLRALRAVYPQITTTPTQMHCVRMYAEGADELTITLSAQDGTAAMQERLNPYYSAPPFGISFLGPAETVTEVRTNLIARIALAGYPGGSSPPYDYTVPGDEPRNSDGTFPTESLTVAYRRATHDLISGAVSHATLNATITLDSHHQYIPLDAPIDIPISVAAGHRVVLSSFALVNDSAFATTGPLAYAIEDNAG